MEVFSEKVSPGSVGSATGSATGSVGSVEGTKIALYGAGSVGSVATMGMVARLRNIERWAQFIDLPCIYLDSYQD